MQESGDLVLMEAERDLRGDHFCSMTPWSLHADVYRLSARHATFNNRSAASRRLVTHAGGRPSAAALGVASRRPDRANDGFAETGQKIGRRQTIEKLGKIQKYKGCRRVQASDSLNINAIKY